MPVNNVVPKDEQDDQIVRNNPYMVNNTPPTNTGTPDNSGGTGGGGFLSTLGNAATNQLNNFSGALSNPYLIPGVATALQQYKQAGDYQTSAEKYAGDLNPFGSQRGYYQGLLADSYKDPTAVLNSPAYQAQLKHGMDSVARTSASQGFLGSGNMETALADYAHTSDENYLENYRNGLITPSGANIGPQSAAAMLMMGLQGRMGAENNAVGNLMLPFMAQAAQNRNTNGTNNSTNPGGNSPNGGNTNGARGPVNANNANQAVQRLTGAGMNPQTAAQLIQAAIQNPGSISPSDMQLLTSLGYGPGNGGVDTAPGGYTDSSYGSGIDPSYGMDPSAGVNSSTTSILNSGDPINSTDWTGGYGSNITTDPTGGGFQANDPWGGGGTTWWNGGSSDLNEINFDFGGEG